MKNLLILRIGLFCSLVAALSLLIAAVILALVQQMADTSAFLLAVSAAIPSTLLGFFSGLIENS